MSRFFYFDGRNYSVVNPFLLRLSVMASVMASTSDVSAQRLK